MKKAVSAKWKYIGLQTREESFGLKDKFGRQVGVDISICKIEQETAEWHPYIHKDGFFYVVKFNGASEFYCTQIQPTRNGDCYQKDTQSFFATLDEAIAHAEKSLKASRNRANKKFSA
jgi:hypothetical protein